jgi:hypothetical protein
MAAVVAIVMSTAACAPAVAPTGAPPTPQQMAEFWTDPGSEPRSLFDGPGGANAPRPASDARYEILSRDTRGFSITYKVRDERGREWHVKIGPEAQTEVVTARIVWALGYHELPSYFVERWIGVRHAKDEQFGGARFRPGDTGLKALGPWSWQQNPFVGTQPYDGLLVLLMILNGTDLKNANNEVYEVLDGTRDHASRWYVLKDLGASLGETGRFDPRRGDIDAFEREPFILGVDRGRVRFGYQGRHQELLRHITVDDVRWTCRRLQKITDAQLRDAFRAGNFAEDVTARYIARIHRKIDEGLRLQ